MSTPLVTTSANIQAGSGSNSPSRKRTLDDFLKGAKNPATGSATTPKQPSKLQLVTDAASLSAAKMISEGALSTAPNHDDHGNHDYHDDDDDELDSPLSEMSEGLVSLLTDAGSATPMRRSMSPSVTPCKSSVGASPQLVITIDATPPAGLAASATGSLTPHPPAKRKRLTPAEREEKARADAARKLEKEKAEMARKLEKERAEAEKKREREEHKAAAEAKKRAAAEEKEKKRKHREDEDRRRAEEKEKKRRDKEDEERKIQEAKDKKERSQLRLNSFFKMPAATSTSTTADTFGSSAATETSATETITAAVALAIEGPSGNTSGHTIRGMSASPRKGATAGASGAGQTGVELSEYDRIFKPFFIKENVIMATSLYGMDEETKEAKSRILDEHLSGHRGAFSPTRPFTSKSAVDYFHLPCDRMQRALSRGRTRPTVRKIMNMMGDVDYGSEQDAQDAQVRLARDLLRSIPMKYLFFREDVRPAYFGTVTSQPPTARLSKLARNPLAKSVLPLNYDYDSEAEWVDDGDGEDVDNLDDDEEELDDDGEMSDFLDDSEDAMPLRPAFSGGMEPESTGICWETERQRAPLPELDNFRMEMILDHDGPIDPFSVQYWEQSAPATDAAALSASTMAPSPTPVDAFAALGAGAATVAAASSSAIGATAATASRSSGPGASAAAMASAGSGSGKTADAKKAAGVAAEFVPDIKKAILQYAKLSKVGIVEMLSVELVGKCTKGQIKNSLEALAERTGTGQNKTWKLKA